MITEPTSKCTIPLRDYQREAIDAIRQAHDKGMSRMLLNLPTGTGKTVVFSHLIRRRYGRALILVHREELITQAADKIRMVMPGANLGIVRADQNQVDADIVIANIQTLSRPERLKQLQANFSTIVIDEAHHCTADSYKRVLEYCGSFSSNEPPLMIGVTATPNRGDGAGLDSVFEEIVYSRTILEMIRAGYLCDLSALQIKLDGADFNQLRSRDGDYIAADVSAMLESANAAEVIARAFEQHAADRKALVFVPSVSLAHEVADTFLENGISAEAVDGELDGQRRRAILARLKSGETQVVVNCAVLTEGFDEPSIDCVVIARPTKSRGLYAQMVGRGTRLYPGKKDCLIMDMAGATSRHDMLSVATLLGLPPQAMSKGQSAREAVERLTRGQRTHTIIDGKLIAQPVNLFGQSRLNWLSVSPSKYILPAGTATIVIQKSKNELWIAVLKNGSAKSTIAKNLPLDYCQGIAEDAARNLQNDKLIDRSAAWRLAPASEKQIGYLRRLGIVTPANLTKGVASDLIALAHAS